MTKNVVWEMPVPSSSLSDVRIDHRPRRTLALHFDYEAGEDCHIASGELVFDNVVQFKITYLPALRHEMFDGEYDRLVSVDDSDELEAVRGRQRVINDGKLIQCLRILFDDGPHVEVFCSTFRWIEDAHS